MADGHRDQPQRPHQAQREDRQHDEWLPESSECQEQQPECERDRESRRELTVLERGAHLVVRERRPSRNTSLDSWKLGAQPHDPRADLVDGRAIIREATTAPHRVGEEKQELLVVGDEVAGVLVALRERKHRAPRSFLERRVTDRFANLCHQGREESKIGGRRAILQPEVEKMAGENAGELPVGAFEETHQARGRDERLDELLMIKDLLPELPERCGRQIQQRPPTEGGECNTVCEVIEGDGTSPELADDPRRKGLRLPECPASNRDDDLVELAEVLGVVTIAGHVWLARMQEVKLRGLEAESR